MNAANILNAEKTREIKKLLEELQNGVSVEEVKEKYSHILKFLDPVEIMGLKALLLQRGIKNKEIQIFCDLHLSLYKESHEESIDLQIIPGHPVFTFLAENMAADDLLEKISAGLKKFLGQPDDLSLEQLQKDVIILKKFEVHYLRKTQVLFPYLEKAGIQVPLSIMTLFQERICEKLAIFYDGVLSLALNGPEIFHLELAGTFVSLKNEMEEMFFKEVKILFPNAIRLLDKKDWGEILIHEEKIGYFRVLPRIQADFFQNHPVNSLLL